MLESRPIPIPVGPWKTGIAIDFREKAFKSMKTNWVDFTDSYADGTRPQKIFLFVYPGAAETGFVYFDALKTPPES